jgi:hypothetical protein
MREIVFMAAAAAAAGIARREFQLMAALAAQVEQLATALQG